MSGVSRTQLRDEAVGHGPFPLLASNQARLAVQAFGGVYGHYVTGHVLLRNSFAASPPGRREGFRRRGRGKSPLLLPLRLFQRASHAVELGRHAVPVVGQDGIDRLAPRRCMGACAVKCDGVKMMPGRMEAVSSATASTEPVAVLMRTVSPWAMPRGLAVSGWTST